MEMGDLDQMWICSWRLYCTQNSCVFVCECMEMVLCRHSEETASINKLEYVYRYFIHLMVRLIDCAPETRL